MTVWFVAAVGGPALAALFALGRLPPIARTLAHTLSVTACGLLLARSIAEGVVASAGFQADAVQAGIALAIALVGATANLRVRRADASGAAWMAAVAGGVGAVLSAHLVSFAAFMIATSVGVGVAALRARAREATRLFVMMAATDILAIGGFALAAESGARAPADAAGAAAWLLGASAIARATLGGSPRWVDAWMGDPAGPRAAVLGSARAQGIVLALWVARADPTATAAMTVAAGVVAAAAAARAVGSRSWGSGLAAQSALVIAGVGIGSRGAAAGALLIAAGVGVATIVWLAGERTAIGPAIGTGALGASLAGAVMVASDGLARGVLDRPFLIVAAPILAALLWLALAGGAGFDRGGARGASVVPAALGLGVGAVMVALPGTVLGRVGDVFVRASTPAAVGTMTPALTDQLGVSFAVAGLAAALAVGRKPTPAPSAEPALSGSSDTAGATRAAWGLEAVAAILVGPVFVAGIARGWL